MCPLTAHEYVHQQNIPTDSNTNMAQLTETLTHRRSGLWLSSQVLLSVCVQKEREREKRHWILFIIHVIDTFGPFKSFKPMYRYLSLQMFVCVRVRERKRDRKNVKGKDGQRSKKQVNMSEVGYDRDEGIRERNENTTRL